MTTQRQVDPQLALLAALVGGDLRVGDDDITRMYIGDIEVWNPAAETDHPLRNILPHGTVAELVAGTETDIRWWAPATLRGHLGAIGAGTFVIDTDLSVGTIQTRYAARGIYAQLVDGAPRTSIGVDVWVQVNGKVDLDTIEATGKVRYDVNRRTGAVTPVETGGYFRLSDLTLEEGAVLTNIEYLEPLSRPGLAPRAATYLMRYEGSVVEAGLTIARVREILGVHLVVSHEMNRADVTREVTAAGGGTAEYSQVIDGALATDSDDGDPIFVAWVTDVNAAPLAAPEYNAGDPTQFNLDTSTGQITPSSTGIYYRLHDLTVAPGAMFTTIQDTVLLNPLAGGVRLTSIGVIPTLNDGFRSTPEPVIGAVNTGSAVTALYQNAVNSIITIAWEGMPTTGTIYAAWDPDTTAPRFGFSPPGYLEFEIPNFTAGVGWSTTSGAAVPRIIDVSNPANPALVRGVLRLYTDSARTDQIGLAGMSVSRFRTA